MKQTSNVYLKHSDGGALICDKIEGQIDIEGIKYDVQGRGSASLIVGYDKDFCDGDIVKVNI